MKNRHLEISMFRITAVNAIYLNPSYILDLLFIMCYPMAIMMFTSYFK